jgi:hypothetical protein
VEQLLCNCNLEAEVVSSEYEKCTKVLIAFLSDSAINHVEETVQDREVLNSELLLG